MRDCNPPKVKFEVEERTTTLRWRLTSSMKKVSLLIVGVGILVYLYKAYIQKPLPALFNGRVHPDFQEVADLYK